jgi:aspartate aminotransferase
MLNSPSNPSGAVYTAQEYRALAEVLERHPDVHVISDEMYEHVLFDGRAFATFAVTAPQLAARTLTVNGLSKTFAMTGWRLGYACGPVELIRTMARMQGQNSLNPSSVSQAAGVAALNGPMDIVKERNAEFQKRRDFIVPRLNAIPGLACEAPHGAFYVYVSCAGWMGKGNLNNDSDVCAYLLEHGVALPNGASYGLSPYFRVSFASSLANLEEACQRIDGAARKLG